MRKTKKPVRPVKKPARKPTKREVELMAEVEDFARKFREAERQAREFRSELISLRSSYSQTAYNLTIAEKRNGELSVSYTAAVGRYKMAEDTIERVRIAMRWNMLPDK